MAQDTKKQRQETMSWIVVLAAAITLCAILFIVFATYLSTINTNVSATNTRLAVMEENETVLLKEIVTLRKNLETKATH